MQFPMPVQAWQVHISYACQVMGLSSLDKAEIWCRSIDVESSSSFLCQALEHHYVCPVGNRI